MLQRKRWFRFAVFDVAVEVQPDKERLAAAAAATTVLKMTISSNETPAVHEIPVLTR